MAETEVPIPNPSLTGKGIRSLTPQSQATIGGGLRTVGDSTTETAATPDGVSREKSAFSPGGTSAHPPSDSASIVIPAQPLVYTVPEVALLLQTSPARVYELVRRRMIPFVRLGRQVRVPVGPFEAWLANGGSPLESAA